MIPKVIHYCWFGGKPLPEEFKEYINSWKKFCPDYKIIEWNEDNFDLNCNDFTREAYEAKKWAFITDYVRLYVLYNYGGIYMDTDVEVLKPLDPFLENEAFSGFESNSNIPTGIMASVKGFKLYKEFLDYYNGRHFKKTDGKYDITTNVVIMTKICEKHGLKRNNNLQNIDGWKLYPSEYFCPKSYVNGNINITKNTITIHHFSGSWLPKETRNRILLKQKLIKKYGKKCAIILYNTFFIPYRLYSMLAEDINKKKETKHHEKN